MYGDVTETKINVYNKDPIIVLTFDLVQDILICVYI